MAAESAAPSGNFEDALREEHDRLTGRVAELRDRAVRLRALAEQAEEMAAREERYLCEVEGLLGLSPQLRIETLHRRLRGQRLLDVAIELLEEQGEPEQVIHYREWYDLLVAAGHTIGGKDPLATFLAQLARSGRIERVAPRSGLYRLRCV